MLLGLIGIVVSAALNIGIFNTALMITRGETATVGKAFTTDRWGEWIVFAIVFQLFVGIGLAFCVIPGLLILAFFGLAPYYFLDQNKSLGDAFSASLAATRSAARPALGRSASRYWSVSSASLRATSVCS